MDKRFFLALFLSLIVIALSQLLFPPAKPIPSSQRTVNAGDSAANANATASSTGKTVGSPAAPVSNSAGATSQSAITSGGPASAAPATAETFSSITPKAVYTFSNVGAVPVSVVLHDYKNQSATSGPVAFGGPGNPLLGYRLITPSDTVDLSKLAFVPSHARNTNGDETVMYTTTAGSHGIAISYTVPHDTSASYLVRVDGRISGIQSPAYLITGLPKTIQPTEADTIGDHRTLAYSFKPQKDHSRSALFGSLDPGEKTLEAGPLNWIAVKNKYFVFAILAHPNGTPFSEATLTGGPRTTKVATTAAADVVQEVRNGAFSFDIYAGPQESQRLARVGRDFDHVNPYGWRFLQGVVHPIASKVIQALLWMHNRLNLTYGWVLVILGVLVRLALWPPSVRLCRHG